MGKLVRRSKAKRKKLEPKRRIRSRLMRLWRDRVVLLSAGMCAMSRQEGVLDAHHIQPRQSNSYLRFDPRNGIALLKGVHKFNRLGPHKGGVFFAEWLRNERPLQYRYVLDHACQSLNLEDRDVLLALELRLRTPVDDEEMDFHCVPEHLRDAVLAKSEKEFGHGQYKRFLERNEERLRLLPEFFIEQSARATPFSVGQHAGGGCREEDECEEDECEDDDPEDEEEALGEPGPPDGVVG